MSNPPQPLDESNLQNTLLAIPAKFTLANSSIINQIIRLVNAKFCGVSLYEHRTDPSLILFLCDCVEQSFTDPKAKKVDKKAMVKKIILILVPAMTPDEMTAVDSIVEFLHSSNSIAGAIEEEVVEIAKPFLSRVASSFRKAIGC